MEIVASQASMETPEQAAYLNEIAKLTIQKNQAYTERNKLVCLLSKVFPSSIQDHILKEGEPWDEDWRKVIYIELPTGQCSWHIHRSEEPMFAHLGDMGFTYDGHSTPEKYQRVDAMDDRYLCMVDMKKLWPEGVEGVIHVTEATK